MKIDGGIGFDLHGIAAQAAKAEADGYDGVFTGETSHDPFLPIAVAAGATGNLDYGTGIAVAFARNPMKLAVLANDLQAATKGRFILGLGSQIKPHITKRFSMPWSHPAPRMRELVLAIRAIWKTWETGEPLAFRGEFYTHTLMTPFFDPGPNEFGQPKILLAGVGEVMTEVAGEVADGFLAHAFTTERYLREVSPAGARARCGQGGEDPGRSHRVLPRLRRDRRGRGRHPGRSQGGAPADCVLRIDAGVPTRARAARLGRPAVRAQHALEAGRVGEDG